MEEKKVIKEFVQKTLGCGCPEEVFKIIDYKDNVPCGNLIIRRKINIGNRLLVYIFDLTENMIIKEIIPLLLKSGKEERDKYGFNRFRLVLAVSNAGSIEKTIFELFNKINTDDKIHLHIIEKVYMKQFKV